MYDNSKRRTYYINSLLNNEINGFQNNYYDYQYPSNNIMSSSYLQSTYNYTDFNSEVPPRNINNVNKLRYTYSINKSTTSIPKILYEFHNISPSELDKKTMELLKLENEINNLEITGNENKSKPKKKIKRSNTKSSINKNSYNKIKKSIKSLSKSKSLKDNITLKRKSSLNLRQVNLINIKKEKYMKLKNELNDIKKQLKDLKERNLINAKKNKSNGGIEKNFKNKNNENQVISDKNKYLELLLQNSNSIVKKQKDLIKKIKMKITELKKKQI